MTWRLRLPGHHGLGPLLLAAVLAHACNSTLRLPQPRDAAPGADADVIQLGGFLGSGGVGHGSGGAGGSSFSAGSGGAATGGRATGGSGSGGAATGGSAAGGSGGGGAGTLGAGGSATGGSVTGGSATGGRATGGRATGGRATGGRATGGSGPGSGGRVGSGGSGGGTPGLDGGGAETGGGGCAILAAEIAKETATTGTCTAVVRLDYSTLAIISHAFVCGKYSSPDEATARQTASADAKLPYAGPVGDGKLLSGSSPADEWVFLQEPGDFGGAAAVSARSGLTVFAGSIVWMGTGQILVPTTWDTSDLGRGCTSPDVPSVRGFNLSQGEAAARFEDAAAVVLDTALPSAFRQWGYVFDVVVLLYPRSVGAFVPETAEYVVLVNGGWLE